MFTQHECSMPLVLYYTHCKLFAILINNALWNITRIILFGTKQEQCFLERNKNDPFLNETRKNLFGNGKEQF